MKKIIFILSVFVLLLRPGYVSAQNQSYQGFCSVGGIKVMTSGLPSSTTVQASYPQCTVSVYLTGTATLANIFANGTGTPLSNPFTANRNASWLFYAASGSGYDVTLSGGTPNAFPTPFTLIDVPAGGSGGGGGNANITPAPQFRQTYFNLPGTASNVGGDNAATTDGNGNQHSVSQSISGTNRSAISALNIFSTYQPNPVALPNAQAIINNFNVSGTGYNYGPAAQATSSWTTATSNFTTEAIFRPGISGFMGGSMVKYSPGDMIVFTCQPCYTVGGTTGNSDQGWNGINIAGGELPSQYTGTIAAGTSLGATTINNTAGATGGSTYMIDLTQTISGGDFTGPPVLTDGIFWIAPIEKFSFTSPYPLTTIVPSTAAGLLACPGGIPQLADETVPQSVTCTVTAMAGAPAPSFSTGIAALAAGNPDIVNITAVSGSSVTFQYRHPNLTAWAPNGAFFAGIGQLWDGTNIEVAQNAGTTGTSAPSWNATVGGTTTDGTITWKNQGPNNLPASLWQGGNAFGMMMLTYPNEAYGSFSGYFCFGATDATHVGCLVPVGGTEATFPTMKFPPVDLLSITSTGGAATSIVDRVTSNGLPYNNLQVGIITNCSDANINGNANTVIYDAVDSTISWTNSNTGTYSCATATLNQAQFYSAFTLSPMAEQVSGPTLDVNGNPTAGAKLGFNNVAFATADQVAEPHPATFGGVLLSSDISAWNPGSSVGGIGMFVHGAGINGSHSALAWANGNPCSFYKGCGGLVDAPTVFQMQGPNDGIYNGVMPLLNHVAFSLAAPADFSIQNCQPEQLFNLNNGGGTISLYPCESEWNMGTNTFSRKVEANQFTVTNEVQPAATDPLGPVSLSSLSNDLLPNYAVFGSVAGAVDAQIAAGEIGAGLVASGSAGPDSVQVGVVGSTGSVTGCYEVTAVTTQGESLPGIPTCINTLPTTLTPSNFVRINAFPTLGANKLNTYKLVGGTYQQVCSLDIEDELRELCTDTGQTPGANAPTVDNSGLFNMLNGKMQANGVLYTWPTSQAAGVLADNGSGVLSWTPLPATPLSASFTTTTTATETVTITGVTSSSHCVPGAQNVAAAAGIASAFVAGYATGSISFTHAATAGQVFDFVCTAN